MAIKTDSQLIIDSTVIKTETITGANTALRVGSMLEDMINSKINTGSIATSTTLGTDDNLVPSQNAVKTYVDNIINNVITTGSLSTVQNLSGSLQATGSINIVGLLEANNIVTNPGSNQIVGGSSANGNVVLGYGNTGILSSYSIIGGQENPDQAANSIAVFGRQNQVGTGYATLVAGRANLANGNHSTVFGYGNTTTGDSSHAQGISNIASGVGTHAEGIGTVTQGLYSHTEGQHTKTIGASSHAEGYLATASGDFSHAEGRATETQASFSHTEGIATITQGFYSHAEGNTTLAIGNASHAEGQNTVAYGNYSHAEGLGTIASGSNQTVLGYYNRRGNTTSLVVIGNGTGDSNASRKDIVRVEPTELQVTGSLVITGSTTINNILRLTQSDPLPTGAVGSLAVSSSNLYYHNGSNWSQIN